MARDAGLAVVAWALGFAVFVSVAGAAVVAPPDPFTQLVVAPLLFVVVAPVVYSVLAADRTDRYDVRDSAPFRYFVTVTVAGSLAAFAAAVVVPDGGVGGLLLRAAAFLAAVGVVSWASVHSGADSGSAA